MKKKTRISCALTLMLALLVAAAMCFSTEPVQAASKYVKAVKVASSATVEKGASTSLVVKVVVKGNVSKKFTVKSADPSIAEATVDGSNVVIKGISVGKTTVKVISKAKNKKKKKIKKKIAVTVKEPLVEATSVSFTEHAKELTLGSTYSLQYTVLPENASDKSVKFSSDTPGVATVDNIGTVTAVGIGNANIHVSTADGKHTDTIRITVTDVKKNITIQLTDESLKEFWDADKNQFVQMIGKTANMRVQLTSGGAALSNQKVSLTMEPLFYNDYDFFRIEGKDLIKFDTTNTSGIVEFPIIPTSEHQNLKPDDWCFQSYKLTATLSGDDSVTTTATLSFACVGATGIEVLNGTEDIPEIQMGTNAVKSNAAPIATTTSLNGTYDEEYVTSQQVDNDVVMETLPYIVLPPSEESIKTGTYHLDVNASSGEYGVYNDETNQTTTTIVEHIPAGLEYANIKFDKLQISDYTQLVVRFYAEGKDGEKTNELLGEYVRTRKQIDADAMSMQIPVQDNVSMYAVIALISEGQVDEDNNGGYTIASIEGSYKGTSPANGDRRVLKDCVSWSIDSGFNRSTNEDSILDLARARTYITDQDFLKAGYTYSYSVPAFPHAGNAVIKVIDDSSKELAYYSYPSYNDENANTIRQYRPRFGRAVSMSEAEFRNSVGTIKADGNRLVVSSEQTGYTAVKATVDLSRFGISNDSSQDLYSSVQWAPIPNTEEKTVTDFFALKGQTVKVTAQLVDRKGNKVTQSGEEINFYAGNKSLQSTGFVMGTLNTSTDTQGQTTFELKNTSDALMLSELEAESESYNVIFTIGDSAETVKTATIHWVDVGLSFTDQVENPETVWAGGGVNQGEESPTVQLDRKTGSTWLLGVQTFADTDFDEQQGDYFIEAVTGIPVKFSLTGGNDEIGLFEQVDNESFRISNSKLNTTPVEARIDSSSITGPVTFLVYMGNQDDAAVVGEFVNVGTGTANINPSMTLNINWVESGVGSKIIVPMSPNGEAIDAGTAANAYVRVFDSISQDPLADKNVTYTVKNGQEVVRSANGTTNEFGLVRIALPAPGAQAEYVISASVQGYNADASKNVFYVVNEDTAQFGINTAAGYAPMLDATAKTVTVNMTRSIRADTLKKEMFTLTDTNSGTELAIESATRGTNENQIVLRLRNSADLSTVVASKVQLVIAACTENGMEYVLTDNDGQKITGTSRSFLTE